METSLYLLLFPPKSLGVLLVRTGVVSVGGGVVTTGSWVVLTVIITVIIKAKQKLIFNNEIVINYATRCC